MKEAIAITSLIVSVGANIPYVIDILKGRAKPERISWLIWTLLGLTYFVSAVFSNGAKFFTFGELIGPIAIFILAIRYGVGGKSKFDAISLVVALSAFTLLFFINHVLVSLSLALLVDGIGAILTLRKLTLDPTSESRGFWMLGALSSVLALVSLKTYDVDTVLFPVYVLIFSLLVIWKSEKPFKNIHPQSLDRL